MDAHKGLKVVRILEEAQSQLNRSMAAIAAARAKSRADRQDRFAL
jgi:hypothetical protein